MSPKKSMADKAAKGRNLTQRNALTAEVQPLVPQHGLVFLSAGLLSTPRRLTVDWDNKTLVVYEGSHTGQSAISSLPEKMKKSLSQSELDHVRAQFDKMWTSSENYLNTPPVADWDVRLILALQAIRRVRGCERAYITSTGPMIGTRESRHINARYRLTKTDVTEGATFDDVIALGAWAVEYHPKKGAGSTWEPIKNNRTFDIPLRSLQSSDTENLFAAGRAGAQGGTV